MSVLLGVCEAVGELVVVRADLSFVIVCGDLTPLVSHRNLIGRHISNNFDLGKQRSNRTYSVRSAKNKQAANMQAGQQRRQSGNIFRTGSYWNFDPRGRGSNRGDSSTFRSHTVGSLVGWTLCLLRSKSQCYTCLFV